MIAGRNVELGALPGADVRSGGTNGHPQCRSFCIIRGIGYHLAVVVRGDPLPWVRALRENGLLTVRGGTDAIRLMPPLTVSAQDLDTSVEILDYTFGTR